jgi:uncharacterized phage protein (TIGR01671 family)
MREILFRGKRTDNGEWVYGSCLPHDGCAYIMPPIRNTGITIIEMFIRVIPETVGQYTGLRDSGWTKVIFEGDIVRHGHTVKYADGKTSDFYNNAVVEYSESNGCYIITIPGEPHFNRLTKNMVKENNITVIGNIHDNPELLKEDK